MLYPGADPEGTLELVRGRQTEMRERVRAEADVRRHARPERGSRLAAFRLWRLHVMVWVEERRGV
jgi:hypothetical protein